MSPRVSRFAPQPVVLPIAGGKGGVGRSVVAANLALALARLDHRVILIDADLGGADLHNLLGLANDRPGLGEVLTGRGLAVGDVVAPLAEPRLAFCPGDAMVPAAANPGFQKKRKLLHAIAHLDADFVLLDLGAGASITVMDFFLASPLGLVVLPPERTALDNARNFLKNAAFRALERALGGNSACERVLAGCQARGRGPEAMRMAELAAELEAVHPGGGLRARRALERVRPKLVLNRARRLDDFAHARQLADWAADELGLMAEVLGFLPEDPVNAAAAEAGAPALEIDPRAPFCQAMARLGLAIGQWAGRGAQWALQRDFTGGFERAATEFAGVFAAGR